MGEINICMLGYEEQTDMPSTAAVLRTLKISAIHSVSVFMMLNRIPWNVHGVVGLTLRSATKGALEAEF